ncbi:hypothetical protein ACA910_012982 [Epithemia clementina (nom. ined.)]
MHDFFAYEQEAPLPDCPRNATTTPSLLDHEPNRFVQQMHDFFAYEQEAPLPDCPRNATTTPLANDSVSTANNSYTSDKLLISIIEDSENDDDDMIVWSELKPKATSQVGLLPASSSTQQQLSTAVAINELEEPLPYEWGSDDLVMEGFHMEMISSNTRDPQAQSASSTPALGAAQEQNSRKRPRESLLVPTLMESTPSEADALSKATKQGIHDQAGDESIEPKMRAGGQRHPKSFANQIENVRIRSLLPSAKQRTDLLAYLHGMTKRNAHSRRVSFEKTKNVSQITLWSYVLQFAEQSLVVCMEWSTENDKAISTESNTKKDQCSDASFVAPPPKRPRVYASVLETFGHERWNLLQNNFKAYQQQRKFEQSLDSIEEDAEGIDCPICCDQFSRKNMVCCNTGGHWLCVKCFNRYMKETIHIQCLTGVQCPDPSCQSLFSIDDVRRCLSEWDQARIAEREEEVNIRVALASKTVLDCKCGTIRIVEKETEHCSKRISCPGCPLEFCLECGEEYHNGQGCQPPPETLQLVKKLTKPCPNCAMPIEKNGGCDHMHCAPPGGCGYHFQYSTGKPHGLRR